MHIPHHSVEFYLSRAVEGHAAEEGVIILRREDLSFLQSQGTGGRGGNGSGDRELKTAMDKQTKFFPGGQAPTFFKS